MRQADDVLLLIRCDDVHVFVSYRLARLWLNVDWFKYFISYFSMLFYFIWFYLCPHYVFIIYVFKFHQIILNTLSSTSIHQPLHQPTQSQQNNHHPIAMVTSWHILCSSKTTMVRCSNSDPSSCQRPCGRMLPCLNHACQLSCHIVDGVSDDDVSKVIDLIIFVVQCLVNYN